jgi:hypothetical protein
MTQNPSPEKILAAATLRHKNPPPLQISVSSVL